MITRFNTKVGTGEGVRPCDRMQLSTTAAGIEGGWCTGVGMEGLIVIEIGVVKASSVLWKVLCNREWCWE